MGNLINVKELANKYKAEIKEFTEARAKEGKTIPTLATVLVGDDEGSKYYLGAQTKVAESLGLGKVNITLPADTTEEDLLRTVADLNADNAVHGIMVLMPLPKHIDGKKVSRSILPEKDIDGVNPYNAGLLAMGEKANIPCTAKSAQIILKETLGDLTGLNVVIVGRSNIVGKPLAQLLIKENATVTVAHSKSKNLNEITKAADVVVAAVGRPHMFNKDFFSPGQTVIDVGTSEKDGKITGDVVTDEAIEIVDFVTSVPGGVGAITTTILMQNVCEAAASEL
ncbi:MAG: bifunctional 5,10-methylenetetrahydrofolate dehydrogenase/5,10-methenyltetrahydrofolate cyclohydrolase [Clostridiaceae bacterium]